jgi:hypothetical protein
VRREKEETNKKRKNSPGCLAFRNSIIEEAEEEDEAAFEAEVTNCGRHVSPDQRRTKRQMNVTDSSGSDTNTQNSNIPSAFIEYVAREQ